jgi:hypothetical protein
LSDQELKKYCEVAAQWGIEKEVILANFVLQEELVALYTLCTVFVFRHSTRGLDYP